MGKEHDLSQRLFSIAVVGIVGLTIVGVIYFRFADPAFLSQSGTQILQSQPVIFTIAGSVLLIAYSLLLIRSRRSAALRGRLGKVIGATITARLATVLFFFAMLLLGFLIWGLPSGRL